MSKFTWNDESTAQLIAKLEGISYVSQDTLKEIAEDLGHTARGVGSKIRSMVKNGEISVEVQKASEVVRNAWATEDEEALVDFLTQNDGQMTYSEIAAVFLGGKFGSKVIQGKVLSLELTDKVKKAEKAAAKRTYTDKEEAIYIEMAGQGASLEAVAETLGRPLNSIRGKGLSLQKEGRIQDIPHQSTSTAKVREDWMATVVDKLDSMTVAEIAEATGKSERGIKNTLTRRGLSCVDHNGAGKREKLDAKAE
jgi:predicted transcriptional regulator